MVDSARVSRRRTLQLGTAAVAASLFRHGVAGAQEPAPTAGGSGSLHGLSAFGDLKYPADFAHFAYVNPDAPKGGRFSELVGAGTATFNSLNGFVLRGDPAVSLELCFASLMARAYDEPDAVYGLAAERVDIAEGGTLFVFHLREGLTFHDGSPLTAEDIVFSLDILKKEGHPNIRFQLRDMTAATVQDARTVALRFAPSRGRDAPLFAASLPIFSRAYYATRKFDESTLEPPLGSGPYRIGPFEQGRFLEFERVANWWGTNLPAVRGAFNFDRLRYEYYRDRDVAFEGFTARNYDFREEYTARVWSTRYDFPAVSDGRVKREVIPDERPSGAQGWIINTRREKLADPRVREALALAFDFEWTNKTIMYGAYDRTQSYFQNSDMMAKGPPGPAELALLEPFRDRLGDKAFNDLLGEPWTPPVTDGTGQNREQRRKAVELLNAAGWTVKSGRRMNAKGEPLAVELLFHERSFEPHHNTYAKSLASLGIQASLRLVEPVQYRARVEDFDFDITVTRFVFPVTPGDSLRSYFSSQAAKTRGSFNLAGISDPVVDALVERAIAAESREALTIACRVLDRILRAGGYWIPHWSKASHWIAYWDSFGRPDTKPRYARGVPETWWIAGQDGKTTP